MVKKKNVHFSWLSSTFTVSGTVVSSLTPETGPWLGDSLPETVENIDKSQYCLMVRGTITGTITVIVTLIVAVRCCALLFCTVHTVLYRTVLYSSDQTFPTKKLCKGA